MIRRPQPCRPPDEYGGLVHAKTPWKTFWARGRATKDEYLLLIVPVLDFLDTSCVGLPYEAGNEQGFYSSTPQCSQPQ